jgi:hypothetical protein
MSMTFSKKLLRFLFPEDERARMAMREARTRACASADDLTRTIAMDGEKIREIIRSKRVNGHKK